MLLFLTEAAVQAVAGVRVAAHGVNLLQHVYQAVDMVVVGQWWGRWGSCPSATRRTLLIS
ncbi:MAG: hypothetical protein ACLTMP_08735 [Eggerthella lenta]